MGMLIRVESARQPGQPAQGLSVLRGSSSESDPIIAEVMMLIAHITDTHITPPGTLFMSIVDTASAVARAVAALNRLDPSPDLVVLTGDLVESGKPEEYAHLCLLLAPLRLPLLAVPGNHDAREPMRQAFGGKLARGWSTRSAKNRVCRGSLAAVAMLA